MNEPEYEVVLPLVGDNPYEWLTAHNLQHHFIRSELKPVPINGRMALRLAVILSDRNTALMMKLAIG